MQVLTSFLLVLILVSGCVQASEFLSGRVTTEDGAIQYPATLEPIQLGVTTQEEIQHLFGNPTDRHITSQIDMSGESWAYAFADPAIQPLQYVPLLGVLALPRFPYPQSFSLNFTPKSTVEGLSWRTVQAFGDAHDNLIKLSPGSEMPMDATQNPLVRNLVTSQEASRRN